MVGSAAPVAELSYEDYLALERATGQRYEWVDGAACAMADGTIAHRRIAAQIIMELGRTLGDRPCGVHTSDQKVRGKRFASYPDVTVCGEVEAADDDPNAIVNPVVLVEVLSDSTETWDRGGKFRRYRKFESLRDYVLTRCASFHARGSAPRARSPPGYSKRSRRTRSGASRPNERRGSRSSLSMVRSAVPCTVRPLRIARW